MEQVFEVTPESFQADVVERSANTPVLLLFWTEQAAPAVEAKRQLEGLVAQYAGKAALGLVDVAKDQSLAQHLRVQALPSLRVIDKGQIAHQLEGPQPEQALRALLDQLTMSATDLIRAQLAQHLERGDLRGARRFLQQALREEPKNPHFRVELADVLVRLGQLDEARRILASTPADTAERDRPQTRLELAEEAAALPSPDKLNAQLQEDPKNLEVRCQLAVAEAAQGNFEAALKQALQVLQADRSFGDELGRRTLLRLFAVLGKGSELASRYRRLMFNFLH